MWYKLLHTNAPAAAILIRLMVGAAFLSEGIQKFLFPDQVGAGRFEKIGFSAPELTAPGMVLGQGTELACLHLPVKVNGDVALLKGVMKELLAMETRWPGEVLDHTFIRDRTTGFERFATALRATEWEEIVGGSGVCRQKIVKLAELIANRQRIMVTWAMGLTQHRNAVANIQEIVNLLLLRGSIGRPGAGVCPVRGHSNVQGDRTMGIYEKPGDEFLEPPLRLGVAAEVVAEELFYLQAQALQTPAPPSATQRFLNDLGALAGIARRAYRSLQGGLLQQLLESERGEVRETFTRVNADLQRLIHRLELERGDDR